MSRTRRAFAGAATSYFQFAVMVLLQFALAPSVLKYAGQEALGAYSVLGQVIGYLALLDLGFSVTFGRYLSQATGVDDGGEKFRRVMVTGRTFLSCANAVAGAACFVVAFLIGPLLHMSDAVRWQASLAMMIVGSWSVLRTPIAVSTAILVAQQDIAFRNIVATASQAFRLVTSLVLVWAGFGLIGLMVSGVLAELLDAGICYVRVRSNWPTSQASGWRVPDRALFGEMLRFGTHALVINLAVRLVFFSDQIVVGGLFGAVATSIYYSTQMPATNGWTGIWRIADTISPAVNQLAALKNIDRLRAAFLRIHRYTFLLSFPLAGGLLLMNRDFITLWVGTVQYAGDLMTVMLSVFAVMVSTSHATAAFVMAGPDVKLVARAAIAEGICNLFLSLLLGHQLGLAGVMMATVICHGISFIAMHRLAFRFLESGALQMLRESFLPAFWPAGISFVALAFLTQVWQPTSFRVFGLEAFAYLLIHFVSCALLSLDTQDRSWIKGVLRAFKRHPAQAQSPNTPV